MKKIYLLCLILFLSNSQLISQIKTDVLIIGGGASGTMAAIQASRLGVKSVVVEETVWLGGMLTSAGVSAIDGNHKMPSGLWGEFREKLYQHYGGAEAVETGWVSNTLFEPSIGNKILQEMVAQEPNIQVLFETQWANLSKTANGWVMDVKPINGKSTKVEAKVLIDATELGDVMAALKVPYYLGMDSQTLTKESFALPEGNDIVQDLTYVITLKDFGKGANKTIKKPKNYDPSEFAGCCDVSDPATHLKDNNDC